jgi:type IV pilus assembly protein PilQ
LQPQPFCSNTFFEPHEASLWLISTKSRLLIILETFLMKRKLWKQPVLLTPMLAALFMFCPSLASAAPPPQLLLTSQGQRTFLRLQQSKPFQCNAFSLSKPKRLVLDCKGLDGQTLKGIRRLEEGPLETIDIQSFHGDQRPRIRLTVRLRQATRWNIKRRHKSLLVSFQGATPQKSLRAFSSLPSVSSPSSPTLYTQTSASTPKDRTIQDIGFGETAAFSTILIRFQGAPPRPQIKHNRQIVTLDIPHFKLPKNLLRPLDTTEFRGVVQKIEVFARKQGVRLVAQLSQKTLSTLHLEQDLLQWRFPIPASPRQAQASESNYRITYHPKRVGQAAGGGGAPPAAGGADPGAMSADVLATLAQQTPRKRYTGRRISMYFHKVEIHNLLRLFAEISGLNIITSDDVKGRISIKLRNVPWDQAMDLVLKTLKLGMEKEGNIIRIATLRELRQEEEERQRLMSARLLARPQKIRLIPVNYALASQIVAQVRTVLSPKGQVSIDQRTNVLVVKDYVPFLLRAEGLVRSLDTQTPQVLIEARIVEANINFERQFGIQWGTSLLFSPITGNSTGLVFPNPIGIRGGVADEGGGALDGTFGVPNYIVNFPAGTGRGRGTAINFFFGSLTGVFDLSLRLSAAESAGEVKIISAPKIVTLHKTPANIQQGLQIPFSTASAAGTNVQFVAATLQLQVTPQVTTDGSVFLQLNVTNNAPDFSRGGAAGPAISTKTARTNMLIKDGETMVIGGIYSRRTGSNENRVPFLGTIPILGALFKNYTYNDDRAELLIFVTPRIINRAQTLGGRQGS